MPKRCEEQPTLVSKRQKVIVIRNHVISNDPADQLQDAENLSSLKSLDTKQAELPTSPASLEISETESNSEAVASNSDSSVSLSKSDKLVSEIDSQVTESDFTAHVKSPLNNQPDSLVSENQDLFSYLDPEPDCECLVPHFISVDDSINPLKVESAPTSSDIPKKPREKMTFDLIAQLLRGQPYLTDPAAPRPSAYSEPWPPKGADLTMQQILQVKKQDTSIKLKSMIQCCTCWKAFCSESALVAGCGHIYCTLCLDNAVSCFQSCVKCSAVFFQGMNPLTLDFK